ncbi:acyl-CoA dehydratase activase, partial [candidate division CSSED10-310 bacterium]
MDSIGIDIGSVTIGAVVLHNGSPLFTFYEPHCGDIKQVLSGLFLKLQLPETLSIVVTGVGAKFLPTCKFYDDIISHIEGLKHSQLNHQGEIGAILSLGGEQFSLTILDDDFYYTSHEVNGSCASGTGAFLEQQAHRLGLDPATIGDIAMQYEGDIPMIASRCAVFAKSDLIHYQQLGTPIEAIAAGLCHGIGCSISETIFREKNLAGKCAVIGGLALNKKIVHSLRELLPVPCYVPSEPHLMAALGAAVLAQGGLPISKQDLSLLIKDDFLATEVMSPPLSLTHSSYPDFSLIERQQSNNIELSRYNRISKVDLQAYLGIDIGSTSTKMVICDPEGNPVYSFYTRTSGRPIEVVQALFRCLEQTLNHDQITVHWLGCGTTGSGREMIGKLIGADLVINEITAHASAATAFCPDVDTLFEIGGQDSKFCRLNNGHVVQATMNYICAAGTGSFIEEQAHKLNISLPEVSPLALGAESPRTSDRCTVYMERDINLLLGQGFSKKSLLAAVMHAVCANYLANVVGINTIGSTVCFLGATARNKALVAAFEQALQQKIHVPITCHVAGAHGVALLLKDRQPPVSQFKNLSFADFSIERKKERCEFCRNNCELTVVQVGQKKVVWGLLCGREYDEKPTFSRDYRVRKEPLSAFFESEIRPTQKVDIRHPLSQPAPPIIHRQVKPVVGIPNVLAMRERLPFWKHFFEQLQLPLIISRSNRKTLRQGKALTNADFCSPIANVHGHIKQLLQKQVDYIFFPAYFKEDEPRLSSATDEMSTFHCYYTGYGPSIIKNHTLLGGRDNILSPLIDGSRPQHDWLNELIVTIAEPLRLEPDHILEAYRTAELFWQHYRRGLRERSQVLLSVIEQEQRPAIVMLGRPYNIRDHSLNQGIVSRIAELGVQVISGEVILLAADTSNHSYGSDFLSTMHWL